MPDMVVPKDRIGLLEMRISELETWAGPGQAEAFATGLRAVRAELAVMRRVQNQHTAMLNGLTADVAVLKADVAELKADVAELKAGFADMKVTLSEILRRLPAPTALS